ncbi:MAG: response regulator [Leptospiraceae bacterium]|nr:response regulator [Leptospiraceae bacterium]
MQDPILIVDDDDTILESIRTILSNEALNLSFASNGREALELIRKYNYSLLITDLYMPEMDGFELLKKINQMEERPISIVLSASSDIEKVVKLVREGVFDYLVKPIERQKLLESIQKGIDQHNLEAVSQNLEKEKNFLFLQNQEWENYRKKLQRQTYLKNKFSILENVRTSFSQGIGFGSLDSVIQRIQKKAKKEEGFYRVRDNLLELLFENARASRRVLECFEELEELNSSESYEKLSLTDLFFIFLEIVRNVNLEYGKIKNQRIIVSEMKKGSAQKFLSIQKKYFEKIVMEILFNAMKFSLPDSKIFILYQLLDNKFLISFLNSPEPDQHGIIGIPNEYSELVFEPFFRMSKFVHEAYPTLDFGLGLSFVERVVQKYGGKIGIRNIKSHIPETGKILTVVELEFEVIQ